MTLQLDTPPYNHRRYGKPWIAKVTFEEPAGEFHWGTFIGDRGDAGVVFLDNVQPGDVVARGQKDTKTGKNSAPEFYKVTEGGGLEPFDTRAAAWKHWQALFNSTKE